jgi:single stranded DNA-binding protein
MSAEITLTGNLTADPEIRYFDSGTAKAEFSVAVNRVWNDASGEKKEHTSYFKVEAWKYLAEDVIRVLQKGVRVTVRGTIEQKSWDDKETGDKRSIHIVTASQIGLGLISIDSFERRRGQSQGEGSVVPTATKIASTSVKTARPAVAKPKLPMNTKTKQENPQPEEEEPF